MTDEDFLHQFEATQRRQRAEFIEFLKAEGRDDLVEDYLAKLRDLDLGITTAEATWHSISPAQRRVLTTLSTHGGRLTRRISTQVFDLYVDRRLVEWGVAGIKTVRNLASRELLDWDGGAFDPEAAAVLSDRGRFVLKHGPAPRGT